MSISAILDLLKRHYEGEAKQREDHLSPSKVYPQNIQNLDKEASEWAFGCANLLNHLEESEVNGKRVLDFGCGAGTDMIYMRRLFEPKEILGIDLASTMIRKANALFESRGFSNLEAKKCELLGLPDQEPFDLILSNAVVHLNPEKQAIFDHLHKLCSSDGILILSDFVVSKKLPGFMKEHYESSEGLFLFGGLIPLDDYVGKIHKAGFAEVERLEMMEFSPHEEIRTMLEKNSPGQKELEELDSTHFYIITLKCKKNLPAETIAYCCSSCSHVESMQFYRSLNLEIHRNLGRELLDGKINLALCTQCSHEQIPAPYQVHDMKAKKMCFVFPKEYKTQNKRLQKEILEPCQTRLPDYEMDLCFSFPELQQFLN